jgi:hypothetical protein
MQQIVIFIEISKMQLPGYLDIPDAPCFCSSVAISLWPRAEAVASTLRVDVGALV